MPGMRVLIAYDSRKGTTRAVAERIALIAQGSTADVTVSHVGAISPSEAAGADVLFLGAWTHGMFVIGVGPSDGAVQWASGLPSLDGTLAAAHNGLGAALSLLGDHAGARIQLARAAELDQHDPNPLLNLARLNERLGDRRGAEVAWRAALDRDPNAPVPIAVRRSAGT